MNEYLSTKIGKQHLEGRNFLLQLHHIIFISIIWFKSTSFPTHFFSCKYCTHLFPVFSLFLITVCFLSFLFYSQHCFDTQWVIIMTVFPQIIDRVSNYILLFSDPLFTHDSAALSCSCPGSYCLSLSLQRQI